MSTTHPDSPRNPAVRVVGLSKSFPKKRTLGQIVRAPFRRSERVQALTDIDLTIERGELVGLLGPNGAGKTTLIKILCGLVLPERGSAEVFGAAASGARLAWHLGLVHGEERSFYWRLTARENLRFFARLHGLRGAQARPTIDALLERVALAKDADRRFGDFSSGMRQRLAIARALLSDPPVLLMDEPTRSLDPVNAAELRDWIRRDLHRAAGKTILLATHNLREAEQLCDRVAIIAHGRLRALATPDQLRREGSGRPVYRVRVTGALPATARAFEVLDAEPRAGDVIEGRLRLAAEDGLEAALADLRAAGCRLHALSAEEPDLEAVFRRLVGEPPAAGAA